jgi:hypothetical protein
VDRHSSLLVGIGKEYVKERYMPVVLSRISLLGKALLYTQLGMASIFQDEYAYALEKLQPFSETFNKVGKKNTEQERLIREIAAKVLVP